MTSNIRLTLLALFVAGLASPTLVQAGEQAPRVSYAAKKQGRVVFQKEEQNEAMAAQDMGSENTNAAPADIEPAAGGYEQEVSNDNDQNTLADSMRLPRKN